MRFLKIDVFVFLLMLFSLTYSISFSSSAQASSFVLDAPGFKVQKKQGWFGMRNDSYQDALGNNLEQHKGLFGRTTTKTKFFGTEAIKSHNRVQVIDSSGRSMVTTRKTLFNGNQTYVDGTGIVRSIKDLFH